MKRRLLTIAGCLVIGAVASLQAAEDDDGFVKIFDGESFDGWKRTVENRDTWKIEDGALVTRGPRAHIFYTGYDEPFDDFELKVDVKTKPNSNGGIYFHTAYQKQGWPRKGFECQVNVSHGDWKKTGSLYDRANVGWTPAEDNEWWTQHIIVDGRTVTVKIDGKTVLQYVEPNGAETGSPYTRVLDEGTFAFQAHDPNSVVRYKNIRVKRLD